MTTTETESNLVSHARRELQIIGEDEETVRGILAVVQAFADAGHSGGSAPYAIAYIERLLRFQPLTDLTNDSAEWNHIADGIAGQADLWQSQRNSEAFSNDGGKTYYLLSERDATSDDVTPLHTAVSA